MKKTITTLMGITLFLSFSKAQTGTFTKIKSPSNKLLLEGGSSYVEAKSKSSSYGLIIREYNSSDYGNIEVTSNGLGFGYRTPGSHMQIGTNGSVGIGTTTPHSSYKLDVNGDLRVRGNDIYGSSSLIMRGAGGGYVEAKSNSSAFGFIVREYNSGDYGNIEVTNKGLGFGYKTSGSHLQIATNGYVGIGTTSPSSRLHIKGETRLTGTNRTSHFNYSNHEHTYIRGGKSNSNVLINDNGGNVGIGIGSPNAALHVRGSYSFSSETYAMTVEGKSGQHAVSAIKSPDDQHVSQLQFINGSNNKYWALSSRNNLNGANNRIQFSYYNGNSWDQPLVISSNGNVGVGTVTPQSKLAVNGKITAKEVQVTLHGWSDYIFADDYQLQNLSEVESYINANKHLPNIPSEKEVCEKGIDLGEMNSLLLGKIEELTLYTIKQEKSLNEKDNKLKALEERLVIMEEFINNLKK